MGGNTRRITLVAVLAGSLTLVASSLLHGASTGVDPFAAFGVTHVAPGAQETAFDLKALDGATLGSQELAGKVVVLNFWATWCGPCVAEMPHFQKVVDRYKKQKDVVFLAISIDEDKPVVRPFLERNHYTIPVAYDNDAAKAFNVDGVPTTFIVDRNGVIQFSDLGFGGDDKEYIDRLVWRIDALLKETSAAPQAGPIKERKNY